MHIKKFTLENIKGIDRLEVSFKEPAGWHVFIGDNGSGKSTLLQALSLALIGPTEAIALRTDFEHWIRQGADRGIIQTSLRKHAADGYTGKGATPQSIRAGLEIIVGDFTNGGVRTRLQRSSNANTQRYNWSTAPGWFSAGFGPFRRFTGGDQTWEKIFYSNPKAAGHLSIFGENVALTESIEWLQQLNYQSLEGDKEATFQLAQFKRFINDSDLLPHQTKVHSIGSKGVFLKDGAGREIGLTEMSDGFRSVLSLTFELLRQLIFVYGARDVFAPLETGRIEIQQPGVVLIDEVDVHLHPTWQVRIGDWFLQRFPNIQFIVTTHSPLICRAAKSGSIWRLSAPGSPKPNGQVTGTALQRLIYGDILDAYGTELFGEDTTSSDQATALREELARLNRKALRGMLEKSERSRIQEIRSIIPTEEVL